MRYTWGWLGIDVKNNDTQRWQLRKLGDLFG